MNVTSILSLEYLMGNWRSSLHANFFMGWFITGSYFVCAFLAALLANLPNMKKERRAFTFWIMISSLMVLLGINKQLDLQTLSIEFGRQIVRAQGWMDQRRVVQFWFIVAFGTTAIAALILFTFTMRDFFRRFILAFIGLFFIFGFIFMRAAQFHHFDEALNIKFFGTRTNWLLELTGIYLIIVAGLKEIIHLKR